MTRTPRSMVPSTRSEADLKLSTRTRRPATGRRTGRWPVAGVVVATSIAVGGCGSSPSPPPTILNTEKVERAIERSGFAQRRQRVVVTCPSGVRQKKGTVFSCTAVGTRASTRFVVTQLDDSGQVHYEAP